MAVCVLVYGKSGSGKSRSMKSFGEDEIYLVNVLGKPLPFKGSFKYTTRGDNLQTICEGLAKMPMNAAVVDDFGYVMTNMFMRGHGGGDQFKLFNQIGDTVWNFISFIQNLPADKIVYLLMHEDMDDYGNTKLATIGKLLDQKVKIEGMVTVCLRATVQNERHVFQTNSPTGVDIAKSPEGMFEETYIDNDLKQVDKSIREYWGLAPLVAVNIGKTGKAEKKGAK